MLVIKIGGSIIQKKIGVINKRFFALLDCLVQSNEQILMVNGGGLLSRFFQGALLSRGVMNKEILDQIGIYFNNALSEFIKFCLPEDVVYPEVLLDFEDVVRAKQKLNLYRIFIGGAKSTGHSSDYDAVLFAKWFDLNQIIKISNVNYVYDKDPSKFSDARIIEKIKWPDYISIIGNVFEPGGNYPFDPVASKLAMEYKMMVKLTKIDSFLKTNTIDLFRIKGTVIY